MADFDTLPGANNSTTTIPSRMLTAAANLGYRDVEVSFETGEQPATHSIFFAFPVIITGWRLQVTKALAGTDAGTVTLQNNAGSNITPNAVISLPASTALGTAVNNSNVSTANQAIAAGEAAKLVVAKTTPGGRARVQIEYKRTG